ncbi:MAG: chemotaxis protein [Rhodospirillaceae bacterium]|nr:chemotaxis protein [Rhodospirillaceae bacterium]
MITQASRVSDVIRDAHFPDVKDRVIDATGMAYWRDKDRYLATRVGRRMEACGLVACEDYLELLARPNTGRQELDRLIADLTIGETYFFRHREQFDALQTTILPECLDRNAGNRRLRLWSAGCASGAEPYSLAILLERHFDDRLSGWSVDIVATDINHDFIERARKGISTSWEMRGLPSALRDAHFEPYDGNWRIAHPFRSRVRFLHHNLVNGNIPDPARGLAGFDVIVCRNVLIYFTMEMARMVVRRLQSCLVEGGWLILGHAEATLASGLPLRATSFPGATAFQLLSGSAPSVSRRPSAPTIRIPPLAARTGRTAPKPRPRPRKREPLAPLLPPDLGREQPSTPADLPHVRELADRADWDGALAACDRLLDADPMNAACHLYRGLVLEGLDERPAAEEALRKALYLDKDFVIARFHLGRIRQDQGKQEGAVGAFRSALRAMDGLAPDCLLPHGDGLAVSDIAAIISTHLDLLAAGAHV